MFLLRELKLKRCQPLTLNTCSLNVRSKSVGETIDVNVTCPDDNKTSVQITIDLDTIKIKKDRTHKDTIKIDDNLTMKMKYPSMDNFIESNFDTSTQGDDIKTTLEMIVSCIDTIYSEEESWSGEDSSKQELQEFIEQLNSKQFKAIERFFYHYAC